MGFKVLALPVDTPLFTVRATLGGSDFILRFDWNERVNRWFFGLFTAENEPIRIGMKAVPLWDVLKPCASSARPLGKLVFASGTEDPITFPDLGRSALLLYIDPPAVP